jgi:hypothetical protein
MRFTLALDDFHRLSCEFKDDETCATAASSHVADGLEALSDALEGLESEGVGECFWFTSAGEYRWVLRCHESDLVRVAVLWCGSIAVGYQHVVWHEMPLAPFCANLHAELARMAATCATLDTPEPDTPDTGRTG